MLFYILAALHALNPLTEIVHVHLILRDEQRERGVHAELPQRVVVGVLVDGPIEDWVAPLGAPGPID